MTEHYDTLLKFARRKLPRVDAEDAVQNTYLRYLSKKTLPDLPYNYLFVILMNEIVSYFRRTKKLPVLHDEEILEFLSNSVSYNEAEYELDLQKYSEHQERLRKESLVPSFAARVLYTEERIDKRRDRFGKERKYYYTFIREGKTKSLSKFSK